MREPNPNTANSKTEKPRNKKIPRRISETYLHNSGLYYLERYSASSAHFKTVMLRKVKRSCMHHTDQNYEECAKLVDKLIEKFVQSGLLNDDLYLQGMISSFRRKGLSHRIIIQKLTLKGIEPDKTAEYLNRYDENTSDTSEEAEKKAAAIFCRRKKVGAFRPERIKATDPQKEMAKMARAGFQYDVIKKILEMGKEDLEEIIYN